jgi:hypothetical protein
MPVLPLIDLLILMGWTCLALSGVLKAISITTTYQPEIFYLGPLDLLVVAGILLLFALTLAARTWVKAFEPEILAKQRRVSTLHSMTRATEGFDSAAGPYPAQTPSIPEFPTKDVSGS